MNLNQDPTVQQLVDLYSACDQTQSQVVYVTNSGDVRIDELPKNGQGWKDWETERDVKFKLNVYDADLKQVGPVAAKNIDFMQNELKHIVSHWEKGTVGLADYYQAPQ